MLPLLLSASVGGIRTRIMNMPGWEKGLLRILGFSCVPVEAQFRCNFTDIDSRSDKAKQM
jgi:hypothetical protein